MRETPRLWGSPGFRGRERRDELCTSRRESSSLCHSRRIKRDRSYMKERRSKREVGHTSKMSYAAPALEKGLDILELLGRQRDGLTKSQLARSLDRSASEIFRMLVCLEQRGYVAQ